MITQLLLGVAPKILDEVFSTDDRPESEKTAREFRKRLESIRHEANKNAEYAGKAKYAERMAATARDHDARRHYQKKYRINSAKRDGYQEGLAITRDEMANCVAAAFFGWIHTPVRK